MRAFIFIAALALAGCGRSQEETATVDQCMRAVLFRACMSSLPSGPQATKYNDWNEVVSECGDQARLQSYRQRQHVKPECRE